MAIFTPFIAHFHHKSPTWALLAPLLAHLHKNMIPYPIGNSRGNPTRTFLNSKNHVISRYDVIMTPTRVILALFHQKSRIWALLTPLQPHLTQMWCGTLSHRKFIREPNGTIFKVIKWRLLDYDVIMTSKWPYLPYFHRKSPTWALWDVYLIP